MLNRRSLTTLTISLCGLLMSGCNIAVTTSITNPNAKQVTEVRNLTAPHVKGSGIDVTTPNGAIEVIADPALTEVKVTAKVTAFGETDDEAKARLEEIKIKWN